MLIVPLLGSRVTEVINKIKIKCRNNQNLPEQ